MHTSVCGSSEWVLGWGYLSCWACQKSLGKWRVPSHSGPDPPRPAFSLFPFSSYSCLCEKQSPEFWSFFGRWVCVLWQQSKSRGLKQLSGYKSKRFFLLVIHWNLWILVWIQDLNFYENVSCASNSSKTHKVHTELLFINCNVHIISWLLKQQNAYSVLFFSVGESPSSICEGSEVFIRIFYNNYSTIQFSLFI